jgi:hypothetical protein
VIPGRQQGTALSVRLGAYGQVDQVDQPLGRIISTGEEIVGQVAQESWLLGQAFLERA